MALKDKLMTLEDFKAVRDVDVASNNAQFTEIKADLDYYNSVDVLRNAKRNNYTIHGVTFGWNEDGSCSVIGTASDTAVRLMYDTNEHGNAFVPGNTYYIKYSGINISLQVLVYVNSDIIIDNKYYSNASITIPVNATRVIIRLYISSGRTVDETVNPVILNAKTNVEITELLDSNKYGIIDTVYDQTFNENDNLDSFFGVGTWKCNTVAVAQSLINNPFDSAVIKLFVVRLTSVYNNVIVQIVINRDTGMLASRAYNTGWTKWLYSGQTKENRTAIIDSADGWSFSGFIMRSGYTEGSTTYKSSDYLAVSAGDYIELIKCTSTGDYYLCFFYDTNKNYVGGVKTNLRYATFATNYIVVPDGAVYMRVLIRSANIKAAKIYKITDRNVETPDSFGIKTLENYVAETGGRNAKPFANFKTTHKPLFTLIDDDTRNIHQVTDFYKVCDDNGIYGTSACITKFPIADAELKNALLNSELRGHQTVFHCYDQYSNSHWSDEATYRDEILENVGTGIHQMNDMGFSDWKHWVTPAGVTGELIQSLARRYGFSSITSITQNDYVGYDGYWGRWKIPRMELYPDDIGHSAGNTLEGIKAMIDKCVAQNGWLLVGVHLFQEVNYSSSFEGTKGWNNNDGQSNIYALDVQTAEDQARFEERFGRLYELIAYAKNAGMDGVTLGEGISYWDSVFRMYESF